MVVAAAGGGWLAGRNITSPDQAALETEPPPASLITVEVERAELVADVIIRADVGFDEPATLALSGGLGNRGAALVVTSAPERGAELVEGSVAIEIAGRPVFLLVGAVPAFRDLRPQDRGPDVEQLETALGRLGYFTGEPDQLWDEATSAAVEAWYEQVGYSPNEPSDVEQVALKSARDRERVASTSLLEAERSWREANEGPTELELRRARTEVSQASSALDRARRAVVQAVTDAEDAVTAAEDAVAAAEDAVRDARAALAAAEQTVVGAELSLAAAETARSAAANDLSSARLRVQSALDGVHPDSGTVPTAAEHEALRGAQAAAKTAFDAAEQTVENARTALMDATWAVTTATASVTTAIEAVTEAQEKVTEAEADLRDLKERTQPTDPAPDPQQTEVAGAADVTANGSADAAGDAATSGDADAAGDAGRAAGAGAADATANGGAGAAGDAATSGDVAGDAGRATGGQTDVDGAVDTDGGADGAASTGAAGEAGNTSDADSAGDAGNTADVDSTADGAGAADSGRTDTAPVEEPARLETQAELAVRSAEDRLAAAEQALAELLAPPEAEAAAIRLDEARIEMADAEADLQELEATAGVWLPAGELIFLKRLPVRVDLLTAERGSTVSGSFMTVTGSELAVRGSISERDVDRVSEAMAVRIEDRSLEEPIAGTIRLLDRRAGTRDVAVDRHYVEIVAQGIPEQLVGRNVKIVIPVGGTAGPVLVVPNAALSATADGSTRVEVEQSDGTTRFVSVEAGLSTGGRVEVTPIDGELASGDRVVVGVASGE